MADEKALWYVVHTYSGYENKVANDLVKTVENNGMGDLIQEVTVPVEEVMLGETVRIVPGEVVPVEILLRLGNRIVVIDLLRRVGFGGF